LKQPSNDTRKGRFYPTPAGELPSVTTILTAIGKPALIHWAANVERELVVETAANLYQDLAELPKMERPTYITTLITRLGKEKAHQRLLAKAGDIGTQVHKLIDWTIRAGLCQKVGPSPAITDKAMWAFSVYEKWAKSVNLKPILTDQTVYDAELGCAGTLDVFGEVDGVLSVIDFKSGKGLYPENHLQTAVYAYMLRKMGHGDAKQGVLVRLPKVETDPDFEAVIAGTLPDGSRMSEDAMLEVFRGVKRLWEFSQVYDTYKPAETPVEAPSA
jgi:PD-(D/E)XK nuclease superfamily